MIVSRVNIPIGYRVHHRGSIYSYTFTENERIANPSSGWGTVIESVPQRDGTTEYKVRRDAPLLIEGGRLITWWASYHTDRWEAPRER